MTKLEREIAGIWEDVLQAAPIDVRSDFFDLGGDSLALLSLFASHRGSVWPTPHRRCAVRRPYHRGVGATACRRRNAAERQWIRSWHFSRLVIFRRSSVFTESAATCCTCTVSPSTWARAAPFLASVGRQKRASLTRSVRSPRVTSMRCCAHQPVGPYYLGGHSFGAMVAYEMALQLVGRGHQVGLLAIIDQRRPGWRLKSRDAIPALFRILAHMPGRFRDEMAAVDPASRLRVMQQLLRRWSKTALGLQREAADMFELNHRKQEQILVLKAHLRALRDYQPVPSQVPIALFRASVPLLTHLAMDPTLGWSSLVEGDVQVHILPGNHGSIATEPLVRELAKSLSGALDAAQGSRAVWTKL